MRFWTHDWNGCWKPREAWAWAILGSLVLHGLIVSGLLRTYLDQPVTKRVVVPVEAVTLVPFKTGPKGGGGGRPAPAPMAKPEPVAEKPVVPPKPKPKPQVKPRPRPKTELTPPPEPTKAPVINTPAPPPAVGKAKSTETAVAGSRTCFSGTGQGGQGGGRGTGSGGGLGQGQGRGSGSGSALKDYLRQVRQILEKHKDYPTMARRRNIQGVVVVVFTIASGGQVEAFRIKKTSGHDLLDEGAQNTIHRVSHFPPFPAALDRQRLTIEVPLAFRLNHDS